MQPYTDSSENTLSSFPLAGLSILRGPSKDIEDAILKRTRSNCVRVFWTYANCINLARRNPIFKQALNRAEFLLNDGVGLEIAARLKHSPVAENLNGSDWIPKFLEKVSNEYPELRKVFVLGGSEGVISRLPEVFLKRWPHLELVGTKNGYFSEELSILDDIYKKKPAILFVNLGVPKQELFVDRNFKSLQDSGVKIILCGGAVFDYMTGQVQRAPKWVQTARLEWAYRVYREPKRLWKRYLLGNWVFLFDLAKERWSKKS